MLTTQMRIRLYSRTIGCLSLSSLHTVSGNYRPARETAFKFRFAGSDSGPPKKNFAHKDSDQTAQSDAHLNPASTQCWTTIDHYRANSGLCSQRPWPDCTAARKQAYSLTSSQKWLTNHRCGKFSCFKDLVITSHVLLILTCKFLITKHLVNCL